jgi:hypothetical protein
MPVPGPCEASAVPAQQNAARDDAAPLQRAFLDADGIAISIKTPSEDTRIVYAGFENRAEIFCAPLLREPLRRLRIHLDDAVIQSTFTSLILRIYLRRAGTVHKPHGADVIS